MAPFLAESVGGLVLDERSSRMELAELEREFLRKLLGESWVSPPMFDHEIVARLVELGLVETEPLPSGDIEYQITDAGRAAATA
ncbi:hypothetical protein [Bradyrhizobium diazoefficiens]|nr:hypothetical protein [Bradyrhizobium diazoefficiens]